MSARLEHANITVRDIDGMIRFIRTALPDLSGKARGRASRTMTWPVPASFPGH